MGIYVYMMLYLLKWYYSNINDMVQGRHTFILRMKYWDQIGSLLNLSKGNYTEVTRRIISWVSGM